MSAGLMIEVVKYAPACLTAVEWKALMILADDANDKTRVIFTDIENEKFLDEMGVEANRWRSIRASLKRKGVLLQESQGFKGHRAKFRIAPLQAEPDSDPKARGIDAPYESKGAWNPTQRGAEPEPLSNRKERGIGAQRRVESARPTPPTPQEQNHSSKPPPPAVPPEWATFAEEGEGVQGEREEIAPQPDDEPTAQALAFVDTLPFDRNPTTAERADLAYLAGLWFKAGWTHDALMAKCEAGLDSAHDRISAWIKFRLAADKVCKPPPSAGGHKAYSDPPSSAYYDPKKHYQPYKNPTDPSFYDEPFWPGDTRHDDQL